MKYIAYLCFRLVVGLFAITPFSGLYKLSDFLAWILYRILKYRYRTIKNNLSKSFPQKSPDEIENIIQNFYTNLSDVMLESIKGISLPREVFLRRYTFLNPEIFDDFYKKEQHLFVLASHYANWEWGALAFGWQVTQQCVGIYKPIKNPYIDQYIRNSRAKNGMSLESMYQLLPVFKKYQNRPSLYVFISDQTPSNPKRAFWLKFLNQHTPCMRGVDSFARRLNYPVLYADAQRVKRGFYEITFEVLTENPKEMNPNDITTVYMKKLEKIIKEKPEDWLWSHKRWKHTKPSEMA